MKKTRFLCIITVLLLLTSCGRIQKTDYAMGTVVTLSLYKGGNEAVISEAMDIIKEYEKKLSRNIEGSEIDNINQNKTAKVSSDTAELIKKGIYYGDISDGLFDITIGNVTQLWGFGQKEEVPPESEIKNAVRDVDYKKISVEGNKVTIYSDAALDLGGIAKGYIADKVAEYLREMKVDGAIINLGGNVRVIGKNGDEPFKVGIQSPFDKGSTICTILAEDVSVVTSGIYERGFERDGEYYHHILNPKTGYPGENTLASVTVVAEKSVDADALSTALFLQGKEKGMKTAEKLGVDALFIEGDGSITATDGIVFFEGK